MMRPFVAYLLLAASPFAAAAGLFSEPVTLRGTLGEAQVQVDLRPKTEFEGGIEGTYFVFGHSLRILLAGETGEEEFSMEESENGVDVSGHWYGQRNGDEVSGEWTSVNGEVTKPFRLRVLRDVTATAKKAAAKKK